MELEDYAKREHRSLFEKLKEAGSTEKLLRRKVPIPADPMATIARSRSFDFLRFYVFSTFADASDFPSFVAKSNWGV